jgi:hypothetical protein
MPDTIPTPDFDRIARAEMAEVGREYAASLRWREE